VFISGTNSFGNNSIFPFYLLMFTLYRFLYLFLSFGYGVSDISMSVFQMELNDYPHFDLTEDGRLCSMGQHCPGFLRVLYDTLIQVCIVLVQPPAQHREDSQAAADASDGIRGECHHCHMRD
jgi:hypothetical protein